MKFSPARFGAAAGVLGLTLASLALQGGSAAASATYNLMPTPGANGHEMGFLTLDNAAQGYQAKVDMTGARGGATFRFAACAMDSSSAGYVCTGPSGSDTITVDSNGEVHVVVQLNYIANIAAVIGTNTADANDQVISNVSGAVPSSYARPPAQSYYPAPAQAYAPPSTYAPTGSTSCGYTPGLGFYGACAWGLVPGFGYGYWSPYSFGYLPGYNFGFYPGLGYYYLPLATTTTPFFGTSYMFLPFGTSLLAASVCPAGFHGNLAVAYGAFGYPYWQLYGFGFTLPLGAYTTTIFCP